MYFGRQPVARGKPTNEHDMLKIQKMVWKWYLKNDEYKLTEIVLCALFFCSRFVLTIQSIDGWKNSATSDLKTLRLGIFESNHMEWKDSPLQLQLTKANVAALIIVSSRSEFYVLRFLGISKPKFGCLVKNTDYMLQIIEKRWITQEKRRIRERRREEKFSPLIRFDRNQVSVGPHLQVQSMWMAILRRNQSKVAKVTRNPSNSPLMIL